MPGLGVAAACAEAPEAAGLSAHTAQALATGPVSAAIPNASFMSHINRLTKFLKLRKSISNQRWRKFSTA
jgi:hypothetical protein